MNTGKAILGMLVGISAGALLGVLLAPEKGTRMRKKLIRKGEDLKDTLSEKIDERFEDFSDVLKNKMKKAKIDLS